jgi:gliding motility-associated lipoprotein GldJ
LRNGSVNNQGELMANFKRGRGDNMGVAGSLNDNADITSPVRSFWPNDFGLYDMAGNVAEWVADVYRPIIDEEFNDFNYFRGNDYKKFSIGPDGKAVVVGADEIEYKTLSNGKRVATRLPGEIAVEDLTELDTRYRTQFNQGYNVNFRDGDFLSSRNYDPENRKSPSLKFTLYPWLNCVLYLVSNSVRSSTAISPGSLVATLLPLLRVLYSISSAPTTTALPSGPIENFL